MLLITSPTLENTELVDARQSLFDKQVNFHLFQRYVSVVGKPAFTCCKVNFSKLA